MCEHINMCCLYFEVVTVKGRMLTSFGVQSTIDKDLWNERIIRNTSVKLCNVANRYKRNLELPSPEKMHTLFLHGAHQSKTKYKKKIYRFVKLKLSCDYKRRKFRCIRYITILKSQDFCMLFFCSVSSLIQELKNPQVRNLNTEWYRPYPLFPDWYFL